MYRGTIGKLSEVAAALYKVEDANAATNPFLASIKQAGGTLDVFPENWLAVQTFTTLSTQWNVGVGGATGLNYLSVFAYIDRLELPKDEARFLFDDIQVMERAALAEMRNKD